jgi:hypothetical protein
MSGIMDRLRQQAARAADLARESAIRRGVRPFVRLHCEQLAALRSVVGTWNAVAALLAEEGLAWRNGRPVSGSQLRALVSEVRASERRRTAKRQGIGRLLDAEPASPIPHARERRPSDPILSLRDEPAKRRRSLADLLDDLPEPLPPQLPNQRRTTT